MGYGVGLWLVVVALLASQCAGQTSPCFPRDCHDLQCLDLTSSTTPTVLVPDLSGAGVSSLRIRCDFSTDGGRWNVFQRRQDGSVDFEQPWSRYKEGFGGDREFWLGNEHVYRLTKDRRMSLRIDMQRVNNRRDYAVYDHFRVEGERFNYSLRVGKMTQYTTTAGDMLGFLRRVPFSTYDRDNSFGRCAATFRSGWWYKDCVKAYMNGLWRGNWTTNATVIDDSRGMMWTPYDHEPRLKACSMKFRPMSTSCHIPCPNGGTCKRTEQGRYRCLCKPNYVGTLCETLLPCYKTTCMNGGSQVIDGDLCYCKCSNRFRGLSCQYQAHTIGPATTYALNAMRVPDEIYGSPGPIVNFDVYLVAYISAGVLIALLATGFVWSFVKSMRLRKKSVAEDLIAKNRKKRTSIEEESSSETESNLSGETETSGEVLELG